MEIFTFDKSIKERLTEYTDILSQQEILPASNVWTEWVTYIELVIEPVGWQALWNIPRMTCQDLEIHYPTMVLVEVERVDFKELSALVKIIAVQDDEIHLPEKYDVPLIELYPTKNQENAVLDTIGTARCIDSLRFFYNYLWMPWDDDNDDDIDWVTTHLEPRIRLFFDMKKGEIPKKTCELIRSLMRESRVLKKKISKLEGDVSDDDEDQKVELNQENTRQLLKYHCRLQQIKTEMEMLENPEMRDILVKSQESHAKEMDIKRPRIIESYFVWLGGSLEETIESLNKVKSFLDTDIFMKTSNNLQEALDSSKTGDIVILGNGHYDVRGASGLEEGGTIRSIGAVELTVLCPTETESGPSLLDFSGGSVVLENVGLDLGELNAGIIVRQGCVNIFGCRIFVSNPSVIKLGIIVLPGAILKVHNTVFVGLGSAVVVHKGGKALMDGCSFENCVEGVNLYDSSILEATQCNFSNFKEYAIRMETEKYLNCREGISGKLEVLKDISEIVVRDCKFENNIKDDIALRPSASMALASKNESILL